MFDAWDWFNEALRFHEFVSWSIEIERQTYVCRDGQVDKGIDRRI